DPDEVRDVELRIGSDVTVFQSPRERDELVGGTGLEQYGEWRVLFSGTRDARWTGGRRTDDGCDRHDVAVRHVDDDRHSTVRVRRLHLVEQRVLGLPLHVLVDGEQ